MKRYQVLVVCCSKEELRGLIDPSAFRRSVEADLGAAGKVTLIAFEADGEDADLFVKVRREIWREAGMLLTVISREA